MQYARGVPVRQLHIKKVNPSPSPRRHVREGQVQPRTEPNWDSQAMDLGPYASHFALSPEAQAEVARRVRDDVERNAAKQAAIDAKRVANDSEGLENEKIEKELKAATAQNSRSIDALNKENASRIKYCGTAPTVDSRGLRMERFERSSEHTSLQVVLGTGHILQFGSRISK